jgi:hypothetical protein
MSDRHVVNVSHPRFLSCARADIDCWRARIIAVIAEGANGNKDCGDGTWTLLAGAGVPFARVG